MISKEGSLAVHVEFGDCDPAQIVWFPNFFRWIDAASRHFFVACGVPRWTETESRLGIFGTPLVSSTSNFIKTASYGDALLIRTRVAEWRTKSFVLEYVVTRGEDVIMECREVRIFAGRRDNGTVFAHPVPEEIRHLCSLLG